MELSINDIKQLINPTAANSGAIASGETRIVVLQRGWVAVGQLTQIGDQCELQNAQIIRVWGTTKGLGELAADGPTAQTKLDPAGTLRFHILSVVCTFDTDRKLWK